MNAKDATLPMAEDDFPEFTEPPRHKPNLSYDPPVDRAAEKAAEEAQARADAVIARIKAKRSKGTA